MQYDQAAALPAPDAASAAHSEKVRAFLREAIHANGGSISFAEYMQHALYAPGLGYYAAGSTKFGTAGDFITAPEVSPVFGRIIARQVAPVLAELGGGVVLEYGAGSGKLAADLLQSLERLAALPDEYQILEVSADLRERQEACLRAASPGLVSRVRWIDSPPTGLNGVIVANEVLDALPVERFVCAEAGVAELRVVADGDAFRFVTAPAPARLAAAVEAIEADLGRKLAEGYSSEVSLGLPGWIGELAGTLDRGLALLFDYGVARHDYYAEDRSAGWLRCHFRHRAHNDPLVLAGIQDLTAWVDFTAVAAAARAAGLDVAGFVTQAQFLIGGGLDAELQDFASLSLEQQLALSQQIKTLTLPGEMGEHFKCMALKRGEIATPAAFRAADRTHTL